jgi:uncharacterized membrane protein
MDFNLAHLHLLLNHFPTVGMAVGLGLFLYALLRNSDELKRASLVILLGIAILAIPTYLTGNAAQMKICVGERGKPCRDPGVSKPMIEAHESAALVAFGVMEFAGGFAWLGLWQYRRRKVIPKGTLGAVLVLSLVTFGLMSKAANMGGDIRHPEIRDGQFTAGDPPFSRELGAALGGGVPWGWAASETVHFIGLCLLFGIVLLVDLRVLGLMKGLSFAKLHRLLPWAILGFGLNLFTGMAFFVAGWDAMYTTSAVFHWKILLIMVAGANALYFTMFDAPWKLGPGDEAPPVAKAMAASAILLWAGIIYCGTMLPFIGNAF